LPAESRDRAGILFQDPETQLVMARAGDDVAFGLENRCVPADAIWPQVDAALEAVGFRYGRNHPVAALSGGEQQRLALAGVLAARPGVLLLDEPTANLDPEGAALVRDVLRRVLDRLGATMILVEHRVAEIVRLVDRVVVLGRGGSVIADGLPRDVFSRRGEELAAAGVWVPGVTLPAPPQRPRPLPQTLVMADQVGFTYPGRPWPAIARVDAQVRAGEALAIGGPNGSGKSTLAMLLAGLLRPRTGSVVAGEALAPGRAHEPLWRWPARQLVQRIGTVFQDPEHQFLTGRVVDELALGPLRAGAGEAVARRRAEELIARLHLEHVAEANPFTLSGGEQRRVSVATALASAPRVLVLDEPTFGQDRRTWIELLDLLAALRDSGRALALATHDRDFVDALADRTLTLRPTSPSVAAGA
jgi:energy-coupling factor transport system ATP-binding protein